MRDLVRTAGIAGENDGKPLVAVGHRRKLRPRHDAIHDRLDTRLVRLMRGQRDLQIAVAPAHRLEADDARKKAADSPRSDAAQSSRRAVDNATWNTGQDAASNGVVPSSPMAEKAVALTSA